MVSFEAKFRTMKKIILHGFICAFCFTIITSCSKDVKSPSSQTKNTATTKTTSSPGTQTENPNQDNHTCGNHTNSGGGGGY